MANVTITQLPQAGPIQGTESVAIVQNGQTVQTTTGAIAASPSQTQTFLTINSEATLPNSRYLSTGTGLGLTDGGAQSFYRISLNRAAGSLETALTGIVAKDTASSVVARTLQTSGAGLSVTDGNGVSGNPTFSLTGLVASLANTSAAGIVALPNNGSVIARTITGTANEIDVTDGTGATGDPTIGIADNPVLPGTGGVRLPTGTTAERTSINGYLRYNSDFGVFEGYANGAWVTVMAPPGGGVTSVNASGGTTGMSFSGGPITSTGILTLAGTLGVANGGTGATTLTANNVLLGNGTSAVQVVAPGTAGNVLTSNGTTWQSTAPTTGVSTISFGTTGLTPSTATSGAVSVAGTLAVANGGTGVITSSGANSVVLRDASNNITANAHFNGFTALTASATPVILTVASTPAYSVTGSGGQTIQLPNATTLQNGTTFSFNNGQSSGAITVNNNSGTLIVSVPSGGYVTVTLLSNASAAGTWDRHDQTPSNVSWSTNTFDYPGSITSATWNGTAVAINRGGTNSTATPTAGGAAYGTGTAYAFTAAGTAGQVLTSAGAGVPVWSGISGGTF